jgi:cysteine synthase A
MGTLEGLNQANHFPRVVAFETTQSPLLTTGKGGSHRVEGIVVGFYPPFLDSSQVQHFIAIDQEKAFDMCKLLAAKHGIFCGASTGMNVVGAVELAKKMNPDENIVTLECDSGLKYLGSEVYF